MDAKEARKRSLKITGDKEKKNYSEIKSKIFLAADTGALYCNYYAPIMPSVKRKLEEEGYKISEFHDQIDGDTITINW